MTEFGDLKQFILAQHQPAGIHAWLHEGWEMLGRCSLPAGPIRPAKSLGLAWLRPLKVGCELKNQNPIAG